MAATGRLTRQDRHTIAQGMRDDLPYAEIARRLTRPTSTITREVLRNGGPTGYRADQAHNAAERRTRRGNRNPQPPIEPRTRPDDALRHYERQLTEALARSGLTGMPGRVLSALLITDSGSRTAGDLARHLAVSPASVSRAVALLEAQALLRRERVDRRERYVIDDDLWYRSTITTARTNAHVSEIARRGDIALGPDSPAAIRLGKIAHFLDIVSDSLLHAVEHARTGRSTRCSSTPQHPAATATSSCDCCP